MVISGIPEMQRNYVRAQTVEWEGPGYEAKVILRARVKHLVWSLASIFYSVIA